MKSNNEQVDISTFGNTHDQKFGNKLLPLSQNISIFGFGQSQVFEKIKQFII
jgi:hypothetical protein